MNLRESESDGSMGRHLRDEAKESFNSGHIPEHWHTLASQAVTIHATELAADTSSPARKREYAASVAMRARLGLRSELAGNAPYGEDNILEGLSFATDQLKMPGRPDQYLINFAAITALAEAVHGSRLHAVALTGRSAVLALCSESPRFARETNPHLSNTERLKAKSRALGRAGIAAVATAVGPRIVNSRTFTRVAAIHM